MVPKLILLVTTLCRHSMLILITIIFAFALSLLPQQSFGSNLTITQITSGDSLHIGPSINNNGEIIWNEEINGTMQIISNLHGQITTDHHDKYYSEINDNGEIAWCEPFFRSVKSNLQGTIMDYHIPRGVSLSNSGEIIWSERWYYSGIEKNQLISNIRGVISESDIGIKMPDMNDNGEVVWSQFVDGYWQIFSNIKGQITFDNIDHNSSSINNNGEIIWIDGYSTIFSNIQGELLSVSGHIGGVDINDLGALVWEEFNGNSNYRQIMKATPTPIPSTILLLGTGLIGLFGVKRRKVKCK
jgi:hypothetical protein